MKNNVEKIRIKKGKSQEQIARASDLSLSQYRSIEKARTENPRVETAIKIKRALEVEDIEELFDIDN